MRVAPDRPITAASNSVWRNFAFPERANAAESGRIGGATSGIARQNWTRPPTEKTNARALRNWPCVRIVEPAAIVARSIGALAKST